MTRATGPVVPLLLLLLWYWRWRRRQRGGEGRRGAGWCRAALGRQRSTRGGLRCAGSRQAGAAVPPLSVHQAPILRICPGGGFKHGSSRTSSRGGNGRLLLLLLSHGGGQAGHVHRLVAPAALPHGLACCASNTAARPAAHHAVQHGRQAQVHIRCIGLAEELVRRSCFRGMPPPLPPPPACLHPLSSPLEATRAAPAAPSWPVPGTQHGICGGSGGVPPGHRPRRHRHGTARGRMGGSK